MPLLHGINPEITLESVRFAAMQKEHPSNVDCDCWKCLVYNQANDDRPLHRELNQVKSKRAQAAMRRAPANSYFQDTERGLVFWLEETPDTKRLFATR